MKTQLLIIALIAIAFAAVAFAEEAETGNTAETTTLEEALASGKPVAAFFNDTKACACVKRRCVSSLQLFETAVAEVSGDYTSIEVDVSANPELRGKYRARIVPSVIFFDETGEEISRLQSMQIRDKQLREQLAALTEPKTEDDSKEAE